MEQPASLSDEALLQAALGGQGEAWTQLVDRYNGVGMRYVRRNLDDPHQALDIMQNVWLSLLRAVQRQLPDQFAALFWTLLKRRLVDELRKRGRSRESVILDAPTGAAEPGGASLLDFQPGDAPDPLEETVRSEGASLLHQALEQLPDHYRLVIVARQWDGRSNKETARLLLAEGLVTADGDVEKRVENYYYRGLKELKKQLEALGFTGGGSAA